MNLEALTAIVLSLSFIILVVVILKSKRDFNKRIQESELKDKYNNFHLGEMTKHDIPEHLHYVKGPKINKYYSRHTKSQNKEKKGDTYEKSKSTR